MANGSKPGRLLFINCAGNADPLFSIRVGEISFFAFQTLRDAVNPCSLTVLAVGASSGVNSAAFFAVILVIVDVHVALLDLVRTS